MTDEQTQLLQQILEELKALRELNERADSGGAAMQVEGCGPLVHAGEGVIPRSAWQFS